MSCFIKTWLKEHILDSILSFQTIRADRDCKQSGEERLGIAVLGNNRCKPGHVTITEHFCTQLLAVSLHPYYLYISLSQQTQHPNAFKANFGDFNDATLPTFQQFVNCPTRGTKM